MRVVVIDPPLPAVTFEEAARHLRLDGDDDRDYVEALIAAAQTHIDGPEGWLGRSVGIQTLELRMDAWPGCLPFRPVIDIVSVTVDDVAIEGITAEFDGVLNMPMGLPRPSRELRIRYRAGYARWDGDGEDRKPVPNAPAPIKHAILLMIGDLYANRETTAEGARPAIEASVTVDRLLAPYRLWCV